MLLSEPDVSFQAGVPFKTSDLDEARAHLTPIFSPHRLIASGQVSFSHHQFRSASLSANTVKYGTKVDVVAPPMDGFFILQLGVTGYCRFRNGARTFEVDPGQPAMINATQDLRMNWSEDCRQLAVKIPKEMLEQQLVEALQTPLLAPLEFHNVPMPAASAIGIRSIVEAIFVMNESDRIVPSRRTSLAYEKALLSLLLDVMPHNYADHLAGPQDRVAPGFVVRAETYMRSRCSASMTLDDIAGHAGVSARSLLNGFRKFRNSTPMRELRKIRLHRARDLIMKEQRSVTDAAFASGFRHLGKFSKYFRNHFGVWPSKLR